MSALPSSFEDLNRDPNKNSRLTSNNSRSKLTDGKRGNSQSIRNLNMKSMNRLAKIRENVDTVAKKNDNNLIIHFSNEKPNLDTEIKANEPVSMQFLTTKEDAHNGKHYSNHELGHHITEMPQGRKQRMPIQTSTMTRRNSMLHDQSYETQYQQLYEKSPPADRLDDTSLESQFKNMKFANIDVNELNDPFAAFGFNNQYTTHEHSNQFAKQPASTQYGHAIDDNFNTFNDFNTLPNDFQNINQDDSNRMTSINIPDENESIWKGINNSMQSNQRSSNESLPPKGQQSYINPENEHKPSQVSVTNMNMNPFQENRTILTDRPRKRPNIQNISTSSTLRGQNHKNQYAMDFHERRVAAERNARRWMDKTVFDPLESTALYKKLKRMSKKSSKKDKKVRTQRGPLTFGTSNNGWYQNSMYDRPFSRHEAFVGSLVNKYIQFREIGEGNPERERQLASDIVGRIEKYTKGVQRNRRGRQSRYQTNPRSRTVRIQREQGSNDFKPVNINPPPLSTSRLDHHSPKKSILGLPENKSRQRQKHFSLSPSKKNTNHIKENMEKSRKLEDDTKIFFASKL